MKPSLILILLAAAAFAQTAAPSTASGALDQENSRKARALLDQAVEALGGQAYLTYKEKSEEGRLYSFYHGRSNSAGTPFTYLTEYPDKERLEVIHLRSYHFLLFTIGNVPVKDKSDIVLIHNGAKGYEITYRGTAKEEAASTTAFVRRREHSLEWVLRKWINEPGVALFYDGPAIAAQKPAQQLTVMNSHGDSVTLFLDEDTHLPIKSGYSWRDADKYRNVEEEVWDNYRPVQGIMTPHSVTRYLNDDMSHQRFLNNVTYNQDLPASLFEASVTYDPKAGPAKR